MSKQGPETPGKPYRPSNGTEGMLFFESWCERCKNESDEAPCPIIAKTMIYETTDPEYPQEWIVGEDGWGKCTAFDPVEKEAP